MRVLAIIPARGGSKRLPGKNVKPLLGKPLISWTIDFARSLSWMTELEVSTDSSDIASTCIANGIRVERLRPVELATDEATSVDVALELLQWLESQGKFFDVVALMQPTTPVRYAERWDIAYQILKNNECDGVVGVSPSEVHPYLHFKKDQNGFLDPWVNNSTGATRAQDYPFSCSLNGSLYMIKVDALKEQRTFFPKKCMPVMCSDQVENIDIDTLFDWRVAEMLITDWIGNK